MSNYLEIKIEVSQLYSEFLADFLSAFGCNEIVLSEEYFSGPLVNEPDNFIKAYLPVSDNYNETLSKLNEALVSQRNKLLEESVSQELLGSWELSYKIVGDEDWSECWKKYWHPEKIGNRIVICPSWEEYSQKEKDEIIINLDPGGAFGTGSHPTTQLSIIAIEKLFSRNHNIHSVIDVGTGSGILAITAAKFGASDVFGIDIDPVAIEVSTKNSTLNDAHSVCSFDDLSIKKIHSEYDLVIVNILAKTILAMSEDLKRVTKKNGYIILSGLISKAVDNVKKSFESQGFYIEEILNDGEWFAIIAKRE